MTRRPLAVFPSLHGVLLGRVPPLLRYYEDAKPPCHPSRRTSFPSLGDTRDVPRASLPSDPEVPAGRAWSLGSALPLPMLSRETTGFPTFLRNPPVHLPCSPTPVGPTPPGRRGDADAALATSTAKAPARKLSRLNHTASAPAVYASPGFLCPTQDSLRLPARLYRAGFEPAGSAERFLNVSYISSPSLKHGLLGRPSWREEVILSAGPRCAGVPLESAT
jgi:hypothetical protein